MRQNTKKKKKTLGGKQSRILSDINQSKILYNPPPRVMEIKTKVNKGDLIKLKSFCKAKELSVQFSSVTQSCLTLCDPMNHSMLGLPVHHQLPESTQSHVDRLSDVIQPSHPL